MNKKNIITVGIPAYNEGQNIAVLLKSILSQKGNNFKIKEIIVISDNSSDKTVSEVRKIKNPLIKLITGKVRKGQYLRQNQIIDLMSPTSDALIIFEGDTLPNNDHFFENLASSVPKDGNYSLISGDSRPIEDKNAFRSIVNFGFKMRHEIFEKALEWPNVYLRTNGFLSKDFLRIFRWAKEFHEDSFCFRKALESGMPIYRNANAIILFKSVGNIRDYLIQSGKFIKAQSKESKSSNIFNLKMDLLKVINITVKYLLKNPTYFFIYVLLIIISRGVGIFMPNYSPFWSIYKSSKKLSE